MIYKFTAEIILEADSELNAWKQLKTALEEKPEIATAYFRVAQVTELHKAGGGFIELAK